MDIYVSTPPNVSQGSQLAWSNQGQNETGMISSPHWSWMNSYASGLSAGKEEHTERTTCLETFFGRLRSDSCYGKLALCLRQQWFYKYCLEIQGAVAVNHQVKKRAQCWGKPAPDLLMVQRWIKAAGLAVYLATLSLGRPVPRAIGMQAGQEGERC